MAPIFTNCHVCLTNRNPTKMVKPCDCQFVWSHVSCLSPNQVTCTWCNTYMTIRPTRSEKIISIITCGTPPTIKRTCSATVKNSSNCRRRRSDNDRYCRKHQKQTSFINRKAIEIIRAFHDDQSERWNSCIDCTATYNWRANVYQLGGEHIIDKIMQKVMILLGTLKWSVMYEIKHNIIMADQAKVTFTHNSTN